MFIGIDASRFAISHPTGVEIYSKYIIQGIIELALEQQEDKIILYGPKKITDISLNANSKSINKLTPPEIPDVASLKTFFDNNRKIVIGQRIIPRERLWTQIGLSRELFKRTPDVLFIPSHVMPRFTPKALRIFTTIHDIAWIYFDKEYGFFEKQYLHYTTHYGINRAAKIFVPSHATSRDLIKYSHCHENKIVVIPHGHPLQRYLNHNQKTEAHDLAFDILEKIGIQHELPYILYIGRLEEKKNLSRLIQAFARFADHYKEWQLVLAGKPGVGYRKIMKLLLDTEYRERIILTGYLSEQEKQIALSHASMLMLVSLYEGFGLPLLEGFYYNVPVLASNCSALPEVCGDAAYFVDPFDIEVIARGIETIACRAELREKLIEEGKKQLQKFSWKKTVQKTWRELTSVE